MKTRNLNVIFMGTPEFAKTSLEKIYSEGFNVKGIWTKEPKAANRGKKIVKSPCHIFGEENNIPVFTPKSLRKEESFQEYKSFIEENNIDIAVVAAYGIILPKNVLDAPKLGCVNIHGSLLPRWRGAAPIHRAIEAGDKTTGITIMQMDEGLDTGDMLIKEELEISPTETTGTLHDKMAILGGKAIINFLNKVENGETLTPEKQDDNKSCYAEKILKSEAQIDWNEPAEIIERKIRALNPFPKAAMQLDDMKLKVLEATISNKTSEKTPGTISTTNEEIKIVCGDKKILQITKLQKEGKKPTDTQSFLRGYKK
ncbi:MAG: methionyl-tRNA formyltransferase [Alphaproteobacteria bacterium]|jgi:methionyl-tRNA formyltransferase|nr:methionyl-tRNA formyltransferase [Alphaproteobacteria bacterium]